MSSSPANLPPPDGYARSAQVRPAVIKLSERTNDCLNGSAACAYLPAGPRSALVIATTTYDDPLLRRLRAPATDALEFAAVLADPTIGGFQVTSIVDRPAREVRIAIDEFLDGRTPEDLVVIYFSCHGVTDARRRLHFAATDTFKSRLASTGVDSMWVNDRMEECRARRQVLILDCCFSGAFARGAGSTTSLAARPTPP